MASGLGIHRHANVSIVRNSMIVYGRTPLYYNVIVYRSVGRCFEKRGAVQGYIRYGNILLMPMYCNKGHGAPMVPMRMVYKNNIYRV